MQDLCAIIVSHNGKRWLDAALTSLFAHARGLELDVVVVDNGSDGSADHVEACFPKARTIRCQNHGFGHANNRALETARARYVLFLNPDTEVLEGSLAELVSSLDTRPAVALAGVRQLYPDGGLAPAIRRFPSVGRMFAEALGVERVPGASRMLGERVLDPARYDRETLCDWTSGSFMLVRTEALAEVGYFDERFFLFSEEKDLCWRLKDAGWQIVHLPTLTIQHDEGQAWACPRIQAQAAHARLQFAEKHFSRIKTTPYRWLLILRYALRLGFDTTFRREEGKRRQAGRMALVTLLSRRPPF